MARTYALDTEAAKKANSGGKRITEPGAYSGKLVAVFHEKNDKGTESVNLMFQSDAGQEIGPLTIYTHNRDGETLPGYDTINALMTCARCRSLEPKRGKVELYDFDIGQVITKEKDLFPALADKPIGLLLRGEEYEGRNGVKVRMIVAGSYEPSTRLMAAEILAKRTEPSDLDKSIDWLTKNPIKPLKTSRPSAGYAPAVVDDDLNF